MTNEMSDLNHLIEYDLNRFQTETNNILSRMQTTKISVILIYTTLIIGLLSGTLFQQLSSVQFIGLLIFISFLWYMYYLYYTINQLKYIKILKNVELKEYETEFIKKKINKPNYVMLLFEFFKYIFTLIVLILLLSALLPYLVDVPINIIKSTTLYWILAFLFSIFNLIGSAKSQPKYFKLNKTMSTSNVDIEMIKNYPRKLISFAFDALYFLSIIMAIVPFICLLLILNYYWDHFNFSYYLMLVVIFFQFVTFYLIKEYYIQKISTLKNNDKIVALNNLRKKINSEDTINYYEIKRKYDSIIEN